MKFVSRLTIAIVCLQVLLIFFSWIADAYGLNVQSLLSAAGIRWTLSSMVPLIATPYFIWLMLVALAFGIFREAGFTLKRSGYRNKLAWRVVFTIAILFVVCLILLGFVPHAVLLSVTGELFPLPFIVSLVPLCSMFVIVTSVAYGYITGGFMGLSSIVEALCNGIKSFAPAILLYLLIAELVCSLQYVFL